MWEMERIATLDGVLTANSLALPCSASWSWRHIRLMPNRASVCEDLGAALPTSTKIIPRDVQRMAAGHNITAPL